MGNKLRWLTGTPLVGILFIVLTAAMRSDDTLTQLRSEDAKTRERAAEEILQKRRKLIADIEQIVKDFKGNSARTETVKTAIMLLGKLRAVESIPLLIDNLTLDGADGSGHQSAAGSYPCVKALIDIGYPSIDPLLKKVEELDDEKATVCVSCAMERILGKQFALVYMQDRAERQKDERKRARLYKLKPWITKWAESDK